MWAKMAGGRRKGAKPPFDVAQDRWQAVGDRCWRVWDRDVAERYAASGRTGCFDPAAENCGVNVSLIDTTRTCERKIFFAADILLKIALTSARRIC